MAGLARLPPTTLEIYFVSTLGYIVMNQCTSDINTSFLIGSGEEDSEYFNWDMIISFDFHFYTGIILWSCSGGKVQPVNQW